MNRHLEKRRIEREFQLFATKNFEKPSRCKNTVQIRFYVEELTNMISDLERRSEYIPSSAYSLLAEYNQVLNRFIYADYQKAYC